MRRLKNAGWMMTYIIVGGAAFWTPDIIIQAQRGDAFDGKDVGVMTLLLPWTLLTFYGILRTLRRTQTEGPSVAVFMLVGVWILGSTAMTISATFSGGGFARPGPEVWYVIALGILPPYTYIMAAYDGSLLGLILATILMGLMYFKYEEKRGHLWSILMYLKEQPFSSR